MQSYVLDSMLEGLSISDQEGYILYTNPAEDRLFGYEPGELTGLHVTLLNAYPPEENARRVAEVLDHLRVRGSWTGEWLNRRKTGELFRTQARIRAVEMGGRKYWVCVQSEVSDDELQQFERRRLAAIVESSDDAIITKDLDGIITSWNRGAERVFGYTAQEAIGKPVSILAPPDRINEMPSILDRLKNGRAIEHYETERRTKAGRIIEVSLTVSPLRDGSGVVIGASKIARDITESRRMQKELAERERDYANVLANLPDVITRIGPDMRITFISESVRKMEGYSPEHYTGKTHRDACLHPDLASYFERSLSEIFSTGEQRTIEFEVPDPSGHVRYYLGLGVPEIQDGKVVGALTITRDITERKAAEYAQRAVERELMLLVEASSAIIASPRSEEVLRTVLELASRFVAAGAYAVWRREGPDEWVLKAASGLSEQYLDEAAVANRSTADIPQTAMVEDVFAGDMLQGRWEGYRREGIQSMMIVPLWIHGRFSGTVVYYWRTKRKASSSDIRIATALGNLVGAALGSADLYEEETKSRQRAESSERRSKFLARAGAVLSSSLDFNTTLSNVARLAVPDFADWCSADVLNERGETERIVVYHHDPQMMELAAEYRQKYPARENDAGRVAMRTGKSVLLQKIADEQIEKAARDPEHLEMLRRLKLRSLIIAPMVLGSESLGYITFVSSDPGRLYAERDLETAEELARRAAAAISQARLYAHVRESEQRLTLAITAAKLGVWENDRVTGVLTASDQCKRNVGVPPEEELTYERLSRSMHPDDRAHWRQRIEEALRNRTPFEVEYRVLLPDGSQKWVSSYGQAVYSAAGQPLRTVGVTLDVTENRTLLQREKDARRAAELLNGLGPALLTELDPWRLVHRVIGIAAQLVGAEYGILFYGPGPGDPGFLYSFAGCDDSVFGGLPATEQQETFDRWAHHNQSARIADVAPEWSPFAGMMPGIRSLLATPICSRRGETVGGLLFGHRHPGVFTQAHEDIVTGIAAQAAIALENARLFETARATEAALRRSNEELCRANEDLNQFAYSASHDLQEPLRMVAIYSQMLNRRYEDLLDERGREYLKFTVQGAKRMEMLVKDLLAYTQAGSVGGDQAPSTDVTGALEQAIQNLAASIEDSGAIINYGQLPSVRVQQVHLVQLFQNLIGNAVKYRKPGIAPQITVRQHAGGDGMIELCVRDNGIGIPAAYQKQVFGLFKRLHPGDEYSGTGIGLAICQRIVERYGGRIWLESEEDAGSAFRFTLPAGESAVAG